MHAIMAARSSFSVGESILPVDRLVEAAKSVGAKVVAITDTMSVTALIDFTTKARKAEIKPIIGCRLRFVDDVTWRKVGKAKAPPEFFLTWYTLSQNGMQALFRLLSLANSDERFYGNARLAWDDLYDALANLSADDVAIASGDAHSVVSHAQASDILARVKDALGASNAFLSLVPVDTPYWDTMNIRAIRLARDLELPTLVARPVHYGRDQADAADVMAAIVAGDELSSLWARFPHDRDRYPLRWEEMIEAVKGSIRRLFARGEKDAARHFQEGVKAVSRLSEIAKYEWTKSAPSLPRMAPDEFRAVVESCTTGWKKRFLAPVFGHQPTKEELKDVYVPRLRYELDVLKRLGFCGYFLLVEDVVQFAKGAGILVGPGRGSVGGSLIAYLMGITDCDPIRFNLLFERFINPDRIDLPDADLDFMSARRHEVFEYLIGKYGQEKFAFVSNFMDLKAKSAIRSVGKAFGMSEFDYRCSKLAPDEHGVPMKLGEAAKAVPDIAEFRDANRDVWNIMTTLEGVTRTFGQHAAGVVVAACDVVERAVVERRKGQAVACWDKRMVEDQGLIKMDVLGLTNLDLIDLTLRYIRRRHTKRVSLMAIPLDDPKVLENFAKGLTTGIFQFESGGMRRLLRELGKDGCITFDDVTAATALYRPGPMDSGMMDSFWKRKQGIETIEFDHPLMEPYAKDTYGVMVYQEQVMQAARSIAGYTMAGADKLRKIMGKKLPEEMCKERDKFVDGCMATVGMSGGEAGALFDKIEKFAGYGFNRSHSTTYALISYQSMYLKTYFPVEFVAAALSLMDEDKLPGILGDAKRLGIAVDLPDINLSTDQFEILTDNRLIIPFNRVKGISEKTSKAIMAAREKVGRFTSVVHLEAIVEKRFCNKGHREKLDRIGAFASIEPAQPPRDAPSRIVDQIDLIPGLITEAVPIHRDMHADRDTRIAILEVLTDYREEHSGDGQCVKMAIGKHMRMMAITDSPTNSEEESGQFSFGRSFNYCGDALAENDLTRSDAYWTGLIKRPKADKQVSPDEIRRYAPYLEREIELLQPTVILLLGSAVVRHFLPDFKGKASEAAGKVIYSKALDANLVIGFNPGEVYFSSEKQGALNDVFRVAASLLS